MEGVENLSPLHTYHLRSAATLFYVLYSDFTKVGTPYGGYSGEWVLACLATFYSFPETAVTCVVVYCYSDSICADCAISDWAPSPDLVRKFVTRSTCDQPTIQSKFATVIHITHLWICVQSCMLINASCDPHKKVHKCCITFFLVHTVIALCISEYNGISGPET